MSVLLNMKKKEQYRRHLPHFQQSGQEYFITARLKNSMPPKALAQRSAILEKLKTDIGLIKSDKTKERELIHLKRAYQVERNNYMTAYDDMLAASCTAEINLNLSANWAIMFEAFRYYEGKRLENYAFCVMSNHFHWVLRLFEEDENKKIVYLQDILKVVKGVSANRINKIENKSGRTVWQDESFDVTIRNYKHLYATMLYTVNNPVKAGLVPDWRDWGGTWCAFDI